MVNCGAKLSLCDIHKKDLPQKQSPVIPTKPKQEKRPELKRKRDEQFQLVEEFSQKELSYPQPILLNTFLKVETQIFIEGWKTLSSLKPRPFPDLLHLSNFSGISIRSVLGILKREAICIYSYWGVEPPTEEALAADRIVVAYNWEEDSTISFTKQPRTKNSNISPTKSGFLVLVKEDSDNVVRWKAEMDAIRSQLEDREIELRVAAERESIELPWKHPPLKEVPQFAPQKRNGLFETELYNISFPCQFLRILLDVFQPKFILDFWPGNGDLWWANVMCAAIPYLGITGFDSRHDYLSSWIKFIKSKLPPPASLFFRTQFEFLKQLIIPLQEIKDCANNQSKEFQRFTKSLQMLPVFSPPETPKKAK